MMMRVRMCVRVRLY